MSRSKKIVILAGVAVVLAVGAGLYGLQRSKAGQAEPPEALKITNGPVVEFADSSSALIAWSTSVGSSSIIRYGTDPGKLDQKESAAWEKGQTHRIKLTKLKPGTTYYYMVESGEAAGTGGSAKSAQDSFKTLAANERGRAPAKKTSAGPIAQKVKSDSATLWWMTDDAGPETLLYGASQGRLDKKVSVAASDNERKAAVTGLQPQTLYFFEIRTASGDKVFSGQFMTEKAGFEKSAPVRVSDGPIVEYMDDKTAVIAWTTNIQASSIVRYGTSVNTLDKTATAPWGQETHRVTLTKLAPNTRYYFVVESSQAKGSGAMAKSQAATFSTLNPGQSAMTKAAAAKRQ